MGIGFISVLSLSCEETVRVSTHNVSEERGPSGRLGEVEQDGQPLSLLQRTLVCLDEPVKLWMCRRQRDRQRGQQHSASHSAHKHNSKQLITNRLTNSQAQELT